MKHRGTALSTLAVSILFAVVTAATAQTYTPLYTYPGTTSNTSGVAWPAQLAQGQDGELYSTIQTNGDHNSGSVYKITTTGQYTLLYSFCSQTSCADGAIPDGGVTLGLDGNLWGTTQNGGTHAAGTVFKITPTGALTTLWDFTNGTDDSAPFFPPLQGQDGNMYGVSEEQYNGQYGAFYKMTLKGKLTGYPFNYKDGATPNLPTQGTDLNFYGTTQYGGDPTCKCGVVYEVTAAGKITTLHTFKGYPTDGYRPTGVLVQGNDGDFYGTTYQGGAKNYGSVFKITPAGVLTLLYSFDSFTGDGLYPLAGLALGTDGNFYGTGSRGGTVGYGVLFQITPAGKETILHNFCTPKCPPDGIVPEMPLVQHTDGKFYGTASGNSLCCSVFYSLDMGLAPFAQLVLWSGKVGATAEILGQGFTGTTSVSFNGIPATFTNVSDTYMTALVPAGALTGPVTVKTFTSTMTSNRNFLVTPQIKSFNPTSGKVGTSVTITGVSLAQATSTSIGGKATTFKVNSDTQVTAAVPAGAKTGQKITITTPGGIATSAGAFSVVPSITSFSPTSGKVGTVVTISGNSFTGATKVTFGGVAATSFQVISDTKVDALVPTGALTGPIAVTTKGGTGTSTTNFTVTP